MSGKTYHGILERCDDRKLAVEMLVQGLVKYASSQYVAIDFAECGYAPFLGDLCGTLTDWFIEDESEEHFIHLFPDDNCVNEISAKALRRYQKQT
jgi:hypothetical protein